MKISYEDELGNKVLVPEDDKNAPIGNFKYIFRGANSTLTIGNNVKFTSCNIVLNDNCNIFIGDKCKLKGALLASHDGSSIIINEKTKCNAPCRFHAAEGKKITIGKGCLLSNVRFRTSDTHSIIDLSSDLRINPAKDITIGDNVWIAEEVNIYKGVTIGQGSVVGARSTVTRDLPSNSLCVGSPAKAVKSNIKWDEKLI